MPDFVPFRVALTLLILVGSATAQEPPAAPPEGDDPPVGVVDLGETVITATRTKRRAITVSQLLDEIDARLLRERNYRSTPEILRDVPGVLTQKTGYAQGSPFIRGWTGFRNVFLVDGVRLNNSAFRDGPNQYWNTVDSMSIDRLEVVKGPASVLYGTDAIGGAVQALTKRPPVRFGESGMRIGAFTQVRVASAEASVVGRGEVHADIDGRLGVLLGATGKYFGDLRGGRDVGRQRRTGYEEWAADAKVEYHFSEDAHLVVAHQRVDQDGAMRTHRTIYARPWEGTTVGNERRRELDQDRDLTYAQFHAERSRGTVRSVRANVSWQRQEEQRDRIRSDGRRDIQGFNVGTLGAWVQVETATDIGRITTGIDYYHDNVNSYRRDYAANGTYQGRRIQGPIADDARYDLFGVFVQDELALADRVDLTLGGRWTWAHAEARRVQDPVTSQRIEIEDRYQALIGSARVSVQVDDAGEWFTFGGVSQGFRAPNLSDLTRFDSARSNEIETPTANLDPERFLTAEVGVKVESDTVSGQIGYYYTWIDDLIVSTPTGQVIGGDNEVTKRNSGKGFVNGVELAGRVRATEHWTIFGAAAYQDGAVQSFPTSAPTAVREPLSRLLPVSGHAGIRYDSRPPAESTRRPWWTEAVVYAAVKQDDLSSRDRADTQRIPPGGTPGYVVVTLRGGVVVSDRVTLTGAIENLTNEDYRIHGSGVNEPGTNFVLGAAVRF